MKKIILVLTLFVCSCSCTKITEVNKPVNLKKENDSLKLVIIELQEEINILKDELRFKEREVSYWGHKYDSLSNNE